MAPGDRWGGADDIGLLSGSGSSLCGGLPGHSATAKPTSAARPSSVILSGRRGRGRGSLRSQSSARSPAGRRPGDWLVVAPAGRVAASCCEELKPDSEGERGRKTRPGDLMRHRQPIDSGDELLWRLQPTRWLLFEQALNQRPRHRRGHVGAWGALSHRRRRRGEVLLNQCERCVPVEGASPSEQLA